MQISALNPTPIHEIFYRTAGAGGQIATTRLPLLAGDAAGLPPSLDALVCTSDLQGVELPGARQGTSRLLGELLAEELAALCALGLLPPAERTGILLAGDLYAAPGGDLRGASGDVRGVWLAFQRRFRWVVGVPGNHDRFGGERALAALAATPGISYLDGASCELDGLRCAGIGGIIGNPEKPQRRAETAYARALKTLLSARPDLLILHESPAVPAQKLPGSELITAILEAHEPTLVVCGHCHWPEPLAALPGGGQALNVDSRAVLLRRLDGAG